MLIALILAFITAMAIAACVGFFYSQIAFTHYIKDDILKEETQAIARSNIAIEK